MTLKWFREDDMTSSTSTVISATACTDFTDFTLRDRYGAIVSARHAGDFRAFALEFRPAPTETGLAISETQLISDASCSDH